MLLPSCALIGVEQTMVAAASKKVTNKKAAMCNQSPCSYWLHLEQWLQNRLEEAVMHEA